MENIYGMHKLVGLQPFWSGTPTFSSGTPTFCQMGVLNSCFQNPSESTATLFEIRIVLLFDQFNTSSGKQAENYFGNEKPLRNSRVFMITEFDIKKFEIHANDAI